MVTDIHFHLGGVRNSQDIYISEHMRKTFSFRVICAMLLLQKGKISNSAAMEWAEEVVSSSKKVDRVVALALDWVYDQNHKIDITRTHYRVGNELVQQFAEKYSDKILFGASVNPNREKAIDELNKVHKNGAVLIKLIPSSQDINLDDEKHEDFFKEMEKLKMPLLVHVGIEHTIPPAGKGKEMEKQALNDPYKLKRALRNKVNVIAAHCGLPIWQKDGSKAFEQLKDLFANDPNAQYLYADVSAFFIPYPSLRSKYVDEILNGALPHDRLILGSDFPMLPGPLTGGHTSGMDLAEIVKVLFSDNPLDKNVTALLAKGFSGSILSNADKLLNSH